MHHQLSVHTEFNNHNTIEPVPNKPVDTKIVEETIHKTKQVSKQGYVVQSSELYVPRTERNNDTIAAIVLQTNIDAVNRPEPGVEVIEKRPGDEEEHEEDEEDSEGSRDVYIMNPKHEDRTNSFFAQPGVLAGKSKLDCATATNDARPSDPVPFLLQR